MGKETMDYWKDCVAEAFEDAGIVATKEQIDTVTTWVEGAHDNYGMATGRDCIPNPLRQEISELQKKLEVERSKVVCPECKGERSITTYGPVHCATSQRWKCRGEGKVVR